MALKPAAYRLAC